MTTISSGRQPPAFNMPSIRAEAILPNPRNPKVMSEMEVIRLQAGCKGEACPFGVRRKGAPMERCLACEADAVGNRPFAPKGWDEVCVEPIAWRGAALARGIETLHHSPQRGCRRNTS